MIPRLFYITDIKIKEDQSRLFKVAHFNPNVSINYEDAPLGTIDEITTETVTPIILRKPDGDELGIGMTKKVQDLLGIPYDLLEAQKQELIHVHHLYSQSRTELSDTTLKLRAASDNLSEIHNAGFWRRLKWLFTGVKL